MYKYAILLRRGGLDLDQDVMVIKEGFSWPAFFIPFIWALWRHMWLAAIIYLLLLFATCLFIYFFSPDPISQVVLTLGVAVIYGYVANDLQQSKLFKEGFALCAILKAADSDQAYSQFLLNSPAIKSDLKA